MTIPFGEAIAQSGANRSLLIGNGFSIAQAGAQFSYATLLEKTGLQPGDPIRNVFTALNTVDFELVMQRVGWVEPLRNPSNVAVVRMGFIGFLHPRLDEKGARVGKTSRPASIASSTGLRRHRCRTAVSRPGPLLCAFRQSLLAHAPRGRHNAAPIRATRISCTPETRNRLHRCLQARLGNGPSSPYLSRRHSGLPGKDAALSAGDHCLHQQEGGEPFL
jgi:hypothetical protein